MAYSLNALIGKDALAIVPQIHPVAQLVRLHHGLQMVPLSRVLTSALKAHASAEQRLRWEAEKKTRNLPAYVGEHADLVADLASQLSESDPVAYVEAEFFGGVGGQSAIVWQQRQIVLALDEDGMGAINTALRYLGVQASHSESWFDEFAMVGLGQRRDTEQWAAVAAEQQLEELRRKTTGEGADNQ